MSSAAKVERQVPTLTEVLEEATLASPPELRIAQAPELEVDLDLDASPELGLAAAQGEEDQLRLALLGVVDAAMAEFRIELLSRLELLLDRGMAPRSKCGTE
ncbi:hypothetical protein LNV09_15060 [Paucibacter sp. B2R-40]|uniref:hypothetical protein n=1 Tax=Paucibacter sp. B2R-40 TaxID=2893554 RepID=UPI0021E416C7|nr:hypothetical protein [Paucibacter sp. B2R-40]MCV2355468.1 hypothetical protein [Paucibacter sp. B2R-40]